ncbi:MAG: hypothetical protein SFW35_09160 [Chitinophagales bacterium]|nr:hypothetical protein [Chitinophagales bacterium]
MKDIRFPIIFVTAVWLFYQITAIVQLSFQLTFGLFIVLPLLLIWMVIRILKDGKPSTRTFDEKFYEDV